MVNITVVGSSSIDLVVTAPTRPKAGETIIGDDFQTVPGGKGANQAVAASRLGANVSMIGRVGKDTFGEEILSNLQENKVSVEYVEPVTDVASGTAHITLAEDDNSIIFVKGANDYVTPDYIKKSLDKLINADIVLIQQEIPEETVEFVIETCHTYEVPILLNPAPAREVSNQVIERTTYLTPNEHEFSIMFGNENRSDVLKRYPNKLLITEGKNGVRYFDGEAEIVIPSYEVVPVDTTGAGDTFNASFAIAIAEGRSLEDAIRFANKAASISITKFGAQGGMPTRTEMEE
ncbi:ribokinase [Oceanobacillus iheyensis HTE831]|uniref:Ribokinase n=1 Tax=Oceanobacillus iheyensis (strain DSM 14371 / CIP 107618 / JCM 11309 / KCTC 3954 / HTE831) TaxID=221109 RepID=Q8ENB1_OCEIH|nr:ribokinase [Oceanobacillus iheyensis]BAC14532.1 ribokinase [Oceanobacillus iheyensis HTE831]